MGAGIQRWFRDSDRLAPAIAAWNAQQDVRLAQLIAKTSRRDLERVRRVVAAYVTLVMTAREVRDVQAR